MIKQKHCGDGENVHVLYCSPWHVNTFLHSDVRDIRSLRVSQSLPGNGGYAVVATEGVRESDVVEITSRHESRSRNNRRLNLKQQVKQTAADSRAHVTPHRRRRSCSNACQDAAMTTRISDAADRERRNREYTGR